MIYCKACNAPLVWVKMASGKMMPCDVNESSLIQIIEGQGHLVKGHVPHWATCPHADKFKNRKKRNLTNDTGRSN